jgi:hypothetical protein
MCVYQPVAQHGVATAPDLDQICLLSVTSAMIAGVVDGTVTRSFMRKARPSHRIPGTNLKGTIRCKLGHELDLAWLREALAESVDYPLEGEVWTEPWFFHLGSTPPQTLLELRQRVAPAPQLKYTLAEDGSTTYLASSQLVWDVHHAERTEYAVVWEEPQIQAARAAGHAVHLRQGLHLRFPHI